MVEMNLMSLFPTIFHLTPDILVLAYAEQHFGGRLKSLKTLSAHSVFDKVLETTDLDQSKAKIVKAQFTAKPLHST